MRAIQFVGAFLLRLTVLAVGGAALFFLFGSLAANRGPFTWQDSSKTNFGAAIIIGAAVCFCILAGIVIVVLGAGRSAAKRHRPCSIDLLGYPVFLALVLGVWFSRPQPSPPSPEPVAETKSTVRPQAEVTLLLAGIVYPGSKVDESSARKVPSATCDWPSVTTVPPPSIGPAELANWLAQRAPGGIYGQESYRAETTRPGDKLPMVVYMFRAKAGPYAGRIVVMYMTAGRRE